MNINALVSNVHWLPVVVLTVVSFVIGFAWHQPFLFGKTWKQENFPEGTPRFNAPLIFGGTAILHFLLLIGLSALISGTGALSGLQTGFLISFFWMLPAMGGTYLFANRSLKLLAIDAGMYIVLFSLSGLVLGVW